MTHHIVKNALDQATIAHNVLMVMNYLKVFAILNRTVQDINY